MLGNGGKFFSPYTRSGALAAWVTPAQTEPAAAGTGTEIAGTVGGYVGKEVGNKLLSFVPFGLGSAMGSQLGDSMARSATMGQLSAALAHELNQPLGAILNNVEAARMMLSLTPPAVSDVAEAPPGMSMLV